MILNNDERKTLIMIKDLPVHGNNTLHWMINKLLRFTTSDHCTSTQQARLSSMPYLTICVFTQNWCVTPKCWYGTNSLHHVTHQKSKNLKYTTAEDWNVTTAVCLPVTHLPNTWTGNLMATPSDEVKWSSMHTFWTQLLHKCREMSKLCPKDRCLSPWHI